MAVDSRLPDIELSGLVRSGDQDAFIEIYERYWTVLYLHARKILRNEEEAEDVVQDLFSELWLKRESFTIRTTLSAYLYTWQSNEEVEEEKAQGRIVLSQRKGATDQELKHSQRDVLFGMFFSNLAMYFIVLATAATLFKTGKILLLKSIKKNCINISRR